MAKVMVLGAGSFGTALALLCHRCGHEVTVWSHREEEANRLREEREQKKLLPGVKLPQQIAFTASLQQAGQQDLLILAVPSFAVRQTARQLCPLLQSNQIVVCVAKGLEQGSFHDFSTVLSRKSHSAPMWFCRDRPMPRRSAAKRRPRWWLPPKTRRQRARCRIG